MRKRTLEEPIRNHAPIRSVVVVEVKGCMELPPQVLYLPWYNTVVGLSFVNPSSETGITNEDVVGEGPLVEIPIREKDSLKKTHPTIEHISGETLHAEVPDVAG
ncbi:hypothetical protein LIER_19476 [Lithospermum erythrorhizon]|uniref:Uncharacterized protein n=1 Tax=Lithospermum erythrorhizon TaxID=34254 RepID=A0AAV3QHV0_LITER